MEATSIRFANAARAIALVVGRRGLAMPLFRSPPRADGVSRTVKRRATGPSTVAVQTRRRPWSAVLADMIEGVVVVNQWKGATAEALRDELWSALESASEAAA